MYDDDCKLTRWAYWLYSMQFPLKNRENKNSRNVCLSQIRENTFSRKFLLIQYTNVVNKKLGQEALNLWSTYTNIIIS